MSKNTKVSQTTLIACSNTRNWYAWNDLMPPKPNFFQVIGQVEVSNSGVVPNLSVRIPQGVNPTILLLDLDLIQLPGEWPQVMRWIQARYDQVVLEPRYQTVSVSCCGEEIVQLPVQDIH